MENVKRAEKIATSHNPKYPRVSLDQVLSTIKETYYLRAGDALFKSGELKAPYEEHPAANMTLCFAVLVNGFVVIGK